MEMMLWNLALSVVVGIIGFMAKGKLEHIDSRFNEVDRLSILLNKTREEVARENVTRSEVNQTLDKLVERMDANFARLEQKIDDYNRENRRAQ